MNALVTQDKHDADVRLSLRTSLYPGAAESSIDMVLAYCAAAGLDPMQKPVHIVPMWDSKARSMRDVTLLGDKRDNQPAEPRHKPVPNCPQPNQGNAGEFQDDDLSEIPF